MIDWTLLIEGSFHVYYSTFSSISAAEEGKRFHMYPMWKRFFLYKH